MRRGPRGGGLLSGGGLARVAPLLENPRYEVFPAGNIQDAVDLRTEEKKAAMVRLFPRNEPIPDDEMEQAATRLFFAPEQVTLIQGDPKRGVKVWMKDTFYVGINAV